MNKRPLRERSLLLVGAAGLVGLGNSAADASLFMDLRVLPSQPSYVTDKTFIAGPGDMVTLGLFGSVIGTNGVNDEMLTTIHGLVNSAGSLLGNLSGGYVPAFFTAGASQNGSVLDWDSDGDLDIGLSPTNSSVQGKFVARSPSPTPMPSLNGFVQVGQFIFSVTSPGSDVAINFTIRNNNGGNVNAASSWFEDGSTVSKGGQLSPMAVGAAVTLVPEPSTISALTLAGISLLKRRR